MRNYLLLVLLLISCSDDKVVINRYENGNMKSIHYYNNEKKLDSSHFYYPTGELKQIVHDNQEDNPNFTILYNSDNYKIAEGNILKDNLDSRIGKWHLYNRNEPDSIIEYINVNNKSYVNQIWALDKKLKDTVLNKSNFFEIIYLKDTAVINDIYRIRFYMAAPFYNSNSDLEVVLPKDVNELKEDFSNFRNIKRDTFPSLKNDGFSNANIPEEIPLNHFIEFGIIPQEAGIYRLRGVIIEYIHPSETQMKNYSNYKKRNPPKRIERKIYFDDSFYVKETF